MKVKVTGIVFGLLVLLGWSSFAEETKTESPVLGYNGEYTEELRESPHEETQKETGEVESITFCWNWPDSLRMDCFISQTYEYYSSGKRSDRRWVSIGYDISTHYENNYVAVEFNPTFMNQGLTERKGDPITETELQFLSIDTHLDIILDKEGNYQRDRNDENLAAELNAKLNKMRENNDFNYQFEITPKILSMFSGYTKEKWYELVEQWNHKEYIIDKEYKTKLMDSDSVCLDRTVIVKKATLDNYFLIGINDTMEDAIKGLTYTMDWEMFTTDMLIPVWVRSRKTFGMNNDEDFFITYKAEFKNLTDRN